MRVIHYFCSLLLLGMLSSPAFSQQDDGAGVICYYGNEGYAIVQPANWVNHGAVAKQLGVCGLYTPKGTTLDTSPAVIYPRTSGKAATTTKDQAIKIEVNSVLAELHSRTGGENATASRYTTLTSKTNLAFEVWLFDHGPVPNAYEAIAYYVGENSTYFLVLSAQTKQDRDDNIVVLNEIIERAVPLVISIGDE